MKRGRFVLCACLILFFYCQGNSAYGQTQSPNFGGSKLTLEIVEEQSELDKSGTETAENDIGSFFNRKKPVQEGLPKTGERSLGWLSYLGLMFMCVAMGLKKWMELRSKGKRMGHL